MAFFFFIFVGSVNCFTPRMIVKSLLRERSKQLWWPLHVYMYNMNCGMLNLENNLEQSSVVLIV